MTPGEGEFVAFVREHSARLHRVGYLLTAGDRHLAEDLVQTALIGTFRHWPTLRDRTAAFAYARVALVNAHQDHFRRRWTRERPEAAFADDTTAAATDDIEDRLDLLPLVAQLAPRQRAVVVCRYYEDMSEAQIAEALGCSAGTVKRAAHDALKRLRELTAAVERRELTC